MNQALISNSNATPTGSDLVLKLYGFKDFKNGKNFNYRGCQIYIRVKWCWWPSSHRCHQHFSSPKSLIFWRVIYTIKKIFQYKWTNFIWFHHRMLWTERSWEKLLSEPDSISHRTRYWTQKLCPTPMSVRDIKTGLKLADCWPGYPWFKSHVRGYGYNNPMVFELTIKPNQNNCKKSTIRPAVALGADWVFENPGVGYWTIIFVWYNGTKSSKEWVRALGTATRWSRVATDCNWLQLITTDYNWLTLNKTVHTRKNIQVGNPKNYVNIDTYSPALKFFPDYKNGSKIKLYDEHKKD